MWWLLILLLTAAALLAFAWHRGWVDLGRLPSTWRAWWSGEAWQRDEDGMVADDESADTPQVWQVRQRQRPSGEAEASAGQEPLIPARSMPAGSAGRITGPAEASALPEVVLPGREPAVPPVAAGDKRLPAVELPLAVPRYIRKKPVPLTESAKPVIGLAEVQRNLQYDVRRREKLAAHERRARREQLVKPSMPVIDPEEVRDAVRQLHADRDAAPEVPKPMVVLQKTPLMPDVPRQPQDVIRTVSEPTRSQQLDEQARQQLREALLGKRREAELQSRLAQETADSATPSTLVLAEEPPVLLIPEAFVPPSEELPTPPLLLLAEEAPPFMAGEAVSVNDDAETESVAEETPALAQPLWPPFATVVTASAYQLKTPEIIAEELDDTVVSAMTEPVLPAQEMLQPAASEPSAVASQPRAVEEGIGWRWPDETAHLPARVSPVGQESGPGWHFVEEAASQPGNVSPPLPLDLLSGQSATALSPSTAMLVEADAQAGLAANDAMSSEPDNREALAAKLARLRELEVQYATVEAALTTPPVAKPHVPPVVYGDVALPGLDLLRPPEAEKVVQNEEYLIDRGILIEEKCAEFKVKVSVVDAYAGPVITRYEVEPAVGVRGSQVVNLGKDLSRALGVASIRVVETIPGKTCMGLELPNPKRQMIRLSEIFGAEVFTRSASKLTLALGQDISGAPVVTDLAKAPHLLVAGTTGSGKSVGVNAMILSMLYKATPDEVRFIMIDPKMLELSIYNDIPHLLAPVVTDMKLAANALNWCVGEMEKRYRLMSHLGVRNLAGYNEKVLAAEARGQRLSNPFSLTPETPEPLYTLPFIVVVVDEFADLMMVAGKKIEELIARLAQKARAAGIHLILATQRPSVDVITGLIKANIPTRVAFQVSSKIDSRTILDQMGAESLLGQGDMLFLPPGTGYPQRVHGAFVTDEEVHSVVEYLKQWGEPDYIEGLLTGESEADDEQTEAKGRLAAATETDPLYDEAVEIVLRTRKASISSVQRQLRIGYNRAARLIEDMEAAGIVSGMENNGNRTVLVPQREF